MPPDLIDFANDLVDASTEQALRHVQRQNQPETHPDFDGQYCVDCGLEVHPARVAMGKVRCVPCQTALEYKRRT